MNSVTHKNPYRNLSIMGRDSKEKIKTIDRLLEKYPDMPKKVREKILLCRKMHEGNLDALVKFSVLTGLMNADEYYETEQSITEDDGIDEDYDDDNTTRS